MRLGQEVVQLGGGQRSAGFIGHGAVGPTIPSARMAKAEREFFPVDSVAWTPAMGGVVPGLEERILASDPRSGVATRMLRFAPGTNTSTAGPQLHDFWEEVYIVEGSLHDLTLDQVFAQGNYAC